MVQMCNQNLTLAIFLIAISTAFGQNEDKAIGISKMFTFEQDDISSIEELNKSLETKIGFALNEKGTIISKFSDQYGFYHEKFQQTYNGLSIHGATYTIHSDQDSKANISGYFVDVQDVNITPSISFNEAISIARNSFEEAEFYKNKQSEDLSLVLYKSETKGKTIRLAWEVDCYSYNPFFRSTVFIDAVNEEILGKEQKLLCNQISGTGYSIFNGVVDISITKEQNEYSLKSESPFIKTYSVENKLNLNERSEVLNNNNHFADDSVAVQAHWGADKTLQYYLNIHGRKSYDNDDSPVINNVHYSIDVNNAYWDGQQLIYGDGDGVNFKPIVSLDVVAHELTHGVTEHSANLRYKYESGALNESFSDIFAESVEYFTLGHNDWLIGNDLFFQPWKAIRSLANPKTFYSPDTYLGEYYKRTTNDNGGVHSNSGIQNKWFYLLSVGGSGKNDLGNDYSVTAIGIEKAAKIAYRNLTIYLHTYSTFNDARAGSIQSAIDIYGADSPEVLAVTNAWHAVGIGNNYSPGGCLQGQVIVGFETDSYPGESAWDISDTSGLIIFSNPPLLEKNHLYLDTFTLEDGIYIFNVYDSYGDGICCAYGKGAYTLKVETQTLAGGGSFYGGESIQFCINSEIETEVTDTIPPNLIGVVAISEVEANSAKANWNIALDNIKTAGYRIELNNNLIGNLVGNDFVFSSLDENSQYTIDVQAFDEAGNFSNKISGNFTTKALDVIPVFPVLKLQAKEITESSALITWLSGENMIGDVSFRVHLSGLEVGNTQKESLELSNLESSRTYTVSVVAVNATGNKSNPTQVSFTTLEGTDSEAPTTVQNLEVRNITDISATLQWDSAIDNMAVSHYIVTGNNKSDLSYTTTLELADLESETTYTYTVEAVDLSGNVSLSSEVNFTTLEYVDSEAPSPPSDLHVENLSTETAEIHWIASIDNIDVFAYNVYLDGEFYITTTDLMVFLSNLEEGNEYSVAIIAVDAAGNESSQSEIPFTTLESIETSTNILGSYFELGWDSWFDGGSDCYRYRGDKSYEGQYSIRLRDKESAGSSMTSIGFDLTPFNAVSINFHFYARSMENGDAFKVYLYENFQWRQVGRYVSGSDFISNNFYSIEISLEGSVYNLGNNAKIKIVSDAGSNSDLVYIDNIQVIGFNNNSLLHSFRPVSNIKFIKPGASEEVNLEISISPNPASNSLQIRSNTEIYEAGIYNLEGRRVLKVDLDNLENVDLQGISSGLYLIFLDTPAGVKYEKIIIKK